MDKAKLPEDNLTVASPLRMHCRVCQTACSPAPGARAQTSLYCGVSTGRLHAAPNLPAGARSWPPHTTVASSPCLSLPLTVGTEVRLLPHCRLLRADTTLSLFPFLLPVFVPCVSSVSPLAFSTTSSSV